MVKIIQHLTDHDIRTAVIKHSHHGFDLPADKDTERFFRAGSNAVYAASPNMSLLYRREKEERELECLCQEVSHEVDLIITEGYKSKHYPKIEVVRQATGGLLTNLTNLIGRVADYEIKEEIPCFGFSEDEAIARFIINRLRISPKA